MHFYTFINLTKISTHTPHARRDCRYVQRILLFWISTHTPHARRDHMTRNAYSCLYAISTHTPHARRDLTKYIHDYII